MDVVKLGPVDFGIMRCLQNDPRISVARVAQRLRAPESTVRHRLNRLIRHRIIEFSAVTNPLRLGYRLWVIIEIQVDLPRVQVVARRLAAAPEVSFLAITTGGYDIVVAAVFRSNEELLEFMTCRLAKIPGIIRTSTSSVLELVKRTLAVRLPDRDPGDGTRPAGRGRGRRLAAHNS
jgi:Lrp/AsnC family transcriptional regulator for asnA, asnC and gidA